MAQRELWFVTGSQHLYGEETLHQVGKDAAQIAAALGGSSQIPCHVQCGPTLTTPDAITRLALEANRAPECVGLVCWMHTFSPAKMWIAGLDALQKPFLHLHTQLNRDLPWSAIDMDYMNLHQSAHGGREFGFICSRLRKERTVVVGHWQEQAVQERIGAWSRAACAWADAQGAGIARLGDNMRGVAVTEGDKVEAQRRFGYSVNGYGLGDLVAFVDQVSDAEVDGLVSEYEDAYTIAASARGNPSVREAARIEMGLRGFLEDGGFKGFTTTFENLHGLHQLPGLSVQRLMADGYGFGAEGDWKTAALVRAMKVMAEGLPGGTSFMEDYTYHLGPSGQKVLGAHMLEICPSIAAGTPSLEVHPLGIGGKADPARLVFESPAGPGLNASIVDMGNRFRMIVNLVDAVEPDAPLPALPVARVTWKPRPDLMVGAGAWILAGGAHHTGYSNAVPVETLEDFADMAGLEFLVIEEETRIRAFKQTLRWNEMYYGLAKGF
jgi:L-arabinose isomerase